MKEGCDWNMFYRDVYAVYLVPNKSLEIFVYIKLSNDCFVFKSENDPLE